MRMFLSLWLIVCGVASAQLSPFPPPSTALPSHPFFITKSWIVGGVGDWDYMTMDPSANQLFIAHGPSVQVVDVESGTIAGVVKGLREAHSVVLDQEGGSDTSATDRPTWSGFSIGAVSKWLPAFQPGLRRVRWLSIQRAGCFSSWALRRPQDKTRTATERKLPLQGRLSPSHGANSRNAAQGGPESTLTVIDTERRVSLAQIVLSGSLGFAQADGNGRIYITVSDRVEILRLDAQAIGPRCIVSSTCTPLHYLLPKRPRDKLQLPPIRARPRKLRSLSSSIGLPAPSRHRQRTHIPFPYAWMGIASDRAPLLSTPLMNGSLPPALI